MKRGHYRNGKAPLESANKMLKSFSMQSTQDIEQENNFLPRIFFVDRQARKSSPKIQFFFKKDDAISFSRFNGNLSVWSIDKFSGENSNAGAKYFVVASYDTFWEHYKDLYRPKYGSKSFAPDDLWKSGNSSQSSMEILPFAYEVILEGVPLHLYLDIEASLVTNPNIDADDIVDKLLKELKLFMSQMRLGIDEAIIMNPDLVIFDSSTKKKFSKHIIFKLNKTLFGNNYICGALLRNFHIHLIKRFGKPSENLFYVDPPGNSKSNVKVCILDYAVYTKNRDFRLIGSCKRKGCSSNMFLRWLWVEEKERILTKDLFLKGLIQNADDNLITSHLHCVVDTINDGIPSSSSLRTPQPIRLNNSYCDTTQHNAQHNTTHNTTYNAAQRSMTHNTPTYNATQPNFSIKLSQQTLRRLKPLGERFARHLTNSTYFKNYFTKGGTIKKVMLRKLRDGNYAWTIETTSLYCKLRRKKHGTPFHKARTATFIIWITGLCRENYDFRKQTQMKQMCIANSCTDGHGSSKPEWSKYLTIDFPKNLTNQLSQIIEKEIEKEICRLHSNNLKICLF